METNGLKVRSNGTGNGTKGGNGSREVKDRLTLTLLEPRPVNVEEIEPVLRAERDLKMVADQLAHALEDYERALRAGGSSGLAPRLRKLYEELVELQEEAARELGRAVGDRVAASNRWKVRRGIDVAEPRR